MLIFFLEPTINKRVRLVAGESTGSNNSCDSNGSRSSRRKSAVFTPPAVSAESTLSTQDSRKSSRSNSYASEGYSPKDVKENRSSITRSPVPRHASLTTMLRDDTPSSHRDRGTAAHYAKPLSRPRSPPSTGIYRAHELPCSSARPGTTAYHDSPAPPVVSLPPITSLQPHDSHLYAKTAYPSHQYQNPLDYVNSPHTPFQMMVDADAPHSIRTLPAPDFRSASNAPLLPAILPPPFDGARTTSSLDTLLLAAKVAEKHDVPPPPLS